jgi:membrane-associated phospholipid phosphatase
MGTKGYKKIALLVAVLTGVLIPISRQYLGSHTADQVTSGVLHSLVALVFYRYFLHTKIWKFLNKIYLGFFDTFTIAITSILFLASIAVPFIIYGINTNHR